jgi:hypothetical protein
MRIKLLEATVFELAAKHFVVACWLATQAAAIWFPFWALRRRYELDRPLDAAARVVRWSIVLGCLLIATVMAGGEFRGVQIVVRFLGVSFLCWPNLAWHLRRIGRPGAHEGTS